MFDLATRPQPDPASVARLAGVPFDLRLTRPTAAQSYPFTDYVTTDAVPATGTEMLATYAVELEGTLATAVIQSLFTDARAGADDALPLRQTDRRGWVGDEFMPTAADRVDPWGSLLWLVYATKVTDDVLERARFYAQESLAWLVRDGIASRVDVATQWVAAAAGGVRERLAVRPTIWQPGQSSPVYDVLWGTSLQRWATA